MERKGRKRYRVVLSEKERVDLLALVKGNASAHKRRHAHILLLADEARPRGGLPDSEISSVLGIGRATAERVRKPCVEKGIEAALERRQQVNRKARKLDGAAVGFRTIPIWISRIDLSRLRRIFPVCSDFLTRVRWARCLRRVEIVRP